LAQVLVQVLGRELVLRQQQLAQEPGQALVPQRLALELVQGLALVPQRLALVQELVGQVQELVPQQWHRQQQVVASGLP
jgi:hypothetical protein